MYQTLYRKYRPKTFSDVVGQDVVIEILKRAIVNNRVTHAYLFIGPRGTGKTSTAKIFARAVNCLNNIDGDICEKCANCEASSDKECLDIIEIDAASNNGVDEIRNLREKVNLVPSELKYKIYIIDEVHMLTIQAFNALLKTLEEPPEHVIFILATTDPQKIPETITSRCQSFNFSRISEANIVKNLKKISEKEKIEVEDDVLKEIAVISEGGMRDSIGMLDKISSYADNKITIEDFIKVTGLVSNEDLKKFVDCIILKKSSDVIEVLEDWHNKGNNIVQIIFKVLDYLKNELFQCYIEGKEHEKIEIYQSLANLLNEKMNDIRKSSNPRVYIEIMLLNFIFLQEKDNAVSRETSPKNISREIIKEEKNKVSRETSQEIISREIISNEKEKSKIQIDETKYVELMKIRVNNTFVNATKKELNSVKLKIKELEEYTFDTNIGYLVCTILEGNLRIASDKYLVLSYRYDSSVLDNYKNIVLLENLFKEKLNIDYKIAIISDDDWQKYAEEYVTKKKNNEKYEYVKEDEKMFDNSVKNRKNNVKDDNLVEFNDILDIS